MAHFRAFGPWNVHAFSPAILETAEFFSTLASGRFSTRKMTGPEVCVSSPRKKSPMAAGKAPFLFNQTNTLDTFQRRPPVVPCVQPFLWRKFPFSSNNHSWLEPGFPASPYELAISCVKRSPLCDKSTPRLRSFWELVSQKIPAGDRVEN